MKIYFDIHEEDVEAMKEYKLERTKERLGLWIAKVKKCLKE
jgi:hypothetical protein